MAEWGRVTQLLSASGRLQFINQSLLELYAESYGRYREVSEKVDQIGTAIVSRDENGKASITKNPFMEELARLRREVFELSEKLGLSNLGVVQSANDSMDSLKQLADSAISEAKGLLATHLADG